MKKPSKQEEISKEQVDDGKVRKEELRSHLFAIFGTEPDGRGRDNMYLIRDDKNNVLYGIDFSPEFEAIGDVCENLLTNEKDKAYQQGRKDALKEAVEKAEEIIQKERYAGAPYALNQLISILNQMIDDSAST